MFDNKFLVLYGLDISEICAILWSLCVESILIEQSFHILTYTIYSPSLIPFMSDNIKKKFSYIFVMTSE